MRAVNITTIINRIEFCISGHINRIVRQSELIAFHASSDKGEIANDDVNKNVILETVFLNLANGYHEQNGVFIAPKTGLYIFSASVLTFNSNQVVVVAIVKNGEDLARIYGYANAGYHDQGSTTVVTHLNVADQVWLRRDASCAHETIYGARYTTFSGALLVAG